MVTDQAVGQELRGAVRCAIRYDSHRAGDEAAWRIYVPNAGLPRSPDV